MAVRQILPQDTLESGFRVKYNETVGEIITTASVTEDGKLILTKFGDGQIEVFLTDAFFTKQQVLEALDSGANVPHATEEEDGIIRIATDEEVSEGLSDSAAVTPAKLDNFTSGPGLAKSSEGQLTIDLETKQLVSPVISPNWTIYKADGVTPYNPAGSTSKSITVDKGCKVNIEATFLYPAPGANQAAPAVISGDWGAVDPGADMDSAVMNNGGVQITADKSFSVTLSKPKSGLVVVGSQVQFPTGNDTTSDSISVAFRSKGFLGFSANTALTGVQIMALANGAFQTGRARTFTGVTSGAGNYTYYCYEASFGDLANVIQNDALPVLGAFTKLADVIVTNDAGFDITYRVYRSNAANAFTNAKLAFS